MLRAAEVMRGISLLTDVTLSEVHESERLFKEFDRAAKPYKQLLDVYVSRYFGVAHADEFLRLYGVDAIKAGPDSIGKPYATVLRETRHLYEQERFFHWDLEFPEVFIDLERAGWKCDGGFDVVVGNPPWLESLTFRSGAKNYQRANYHSAKGKYDQYALFLERGLDLINAQGFLSMIVQNKFLVTDYGRHLREVIHNRANVTELIDFNGSVVFPDTSTYPLIIKITFRPTDTVSVIRFSSPFETSVVEHVFASDQIEAMRFQMPLSSLKSEVWRLADPDERNLWRKLEDKDNCRPLTEFMIGFSKGAVTCLNEAFIFDRQNPPPVEGELLRPRGTAEDISRYHINDFQEIIIFPHKRDATGKWRPLNLSNYPNAQRYFRSIQEKLSGRRFFGKTVVELGKEYFEILHIPEYYSSSVIVFPKVCKRPEFAFTSPGEVIWTQPAYSMSLRETTNPFFVLSILNSLLITRYMVALAPDLRGAYIELKTNEVQSIPIRRVHFATPTAERQQRLAGLVARYEQGQDAAILAPVAALLPQDTQGHFLAFAPGATGAEEHSDVVHDFLAHLAGQMIDLNKQKQAEQKRFLSWLEAALHITPDKKGNAGLDALTGKTRILGYLGDYQKGEPETPWAEIEDVLYKNKGRLGVSLSDAGLLARLRAEYEKSLDTLRPVKVQLARTDRLIDQVVYRLYGLTEEEIALVEGKSGEQSVLSERILTSGKGPRTIARQSDPREMAQVMEVLAQHGSLTTFRLSAILADFKISFEPDKAETVQREFRFVGWLDSESSEWALTEAGKAVAAIRPAANLEEFALRLALANEQYNQHIISRLLWRMWTLNPDGQGAVILPQPPLVDFPDSLDALGTWLASFCWESPTGT